MAKKTVLIPITVPRGKYCWNEERVEICRYLSNEKGEYPTCYFGFSPIICEKGNIRKPHGCLELKAENAL